MLYNYNVIALPLAQTAAHTHYDRVRIELVENRLSVSESADKGTN